MEAVLVFVSVPGPGEAGDVGGKLAKIVVRERLAACVNRIPGVESFYMWKGDLVQKGEELLMIKTTHSCVVPLKTRILELHPYELPEFLVVSVSEGSDAYMHWIRTATLRM